MYKTVLTSFIHTTTHIDKLDMGIELPRQGDVGLLDTSDLLLVWPLFEASVIGSHCKMLRRLANLGGQHSYVTQAQAEVGLKSFRILPIGSLV